MTKCNSRIKCYILLELYFMQYFTSINNNITYKFLYFWAPDNPAKKQRIPINLCKFGTLLHFSWRWEHCTTTEHSGQMSWASVKTYTSQTYRNKMEDGESALIVTFTAMSLISELIYFYHYSKYANNSRTLWNVVTKFTLGV